MKPGSRALGVAESFTGDSSVLAGSVVRVDRATDGFVFGTCTVGGTDVTDAVVDLWTRLDRPDARHVLVAGVALAWYNVLDLRELHRAVERPVLAVTFEESDGLADPLREAFSGDALAERLAVYERLPERHRVDVGDDAVFVRSVGLDPAAAAEVVRAHTPAGGRPEPLRVARLAARAVDAWRDRGEGHGQRER
ncbi:MAG: DUF99 family protein [Haloarculaceae archaeon]